jgi:hypothetical protein
LLNRIYYEAPHSALPFSPPFLLSSYIHIFFAALCAQVLNLDHVSHPHKTDGKIFILTVLAFVFLIGDDKENDSEVNGKEH